MRGRRPAVRRSGAGGGGEPNPAGLANEREFLLRSIEDLERELASSDVDAADFAVLHARYRDRLREVEDEAAGLAAARSPGSAQDPDALLRQEDRFGSGPSARRLRRRLGGRRVRLVVGTGAAGCFVVAAALLAASLAGVRLPGESASGSVSLSSAQLEQETLDRAAILGSEGQVAEAVKLYDQVLQTDPNQPDALAYGGWLIRLAGLSAKNRAVIAKGDASVARAVSVAPGYPDGHALLGVIEYEDLGDPRASSAQFRDALRAGASTTLVSSVAAIAVKAFAAAREPLPAPYAAAWRRAASGGGTGG